MEAMGILYVPPPPFMHTHRIRKPGNGERSISVCMDARIHGALRSEWKILRGKISLHFFDATGSGYGALREPARHGERIARDGTTFFLGKIMNENRIKDAVWEAKRFIARVEELNKKIKIENHTVYYISGIKEAGAIRRSSLDLTRALAKMRKP